MLPGAGAAFRQRLAYGVEVLVRVADDATQRGNGPLQADTLGLLAGAVGAAGEAQQQQGTVVKVTGADALRLVQMVGRWVVKRWAGWA